MTPEERARALQAFARLVCEVEAMAHYQIVKMRELRARIAAMERWLQQIELVEGCGEGLARGGEFVPEGAEAQANGVGCAAMVEAVTEHHQQERLAMRSDAS